LLACVINGVGIPIGATESVVPWCLLALAGFRVALVALAGTVLARVAFDRRLQGQTDAAEPTEGAGAGVGKAVADRVRNTDDLTVANASHACLVHGMRLVVVANQTVCDGSMAADLRGGITLIDRTPFIVIAVPATPATAVVSTLLLFAIRCADADSFETLILFVDTLAASTLTSIPTAHLPIAIRYTWRRPARTVLAQPPEGIGAGDAVFYRLVRAADFRQAGVLTA